MSMKLCPNCGVSLRQPTPNERTFARNCDQYKSWLLAMCPQFQQFTVKYAAARTRSDLHRIYKRIKILRRHGLVRLVKRGARGGGSMSPGTSKNTANIYQITEKGVSLCRS